MLLIMWVDSCEVGCIFSNSKIILFHFHVMKFQFSFHYVSSTFRECVQHHKWCLYILKHIKTFLTDIMLTNFAKLPRQCIEIIWKQLSSVFWGKFHSFSADFGGFLTCCLGRSKCVYETMHRCDTFGNVLPPVLTKREFLSRPGSTNTFGPQSKTQRDEESCKKEFNSKAQIMA